MGFFSGPSQKGTILNLRVLGHIFVFVDIERQQKKELRSNERDLDRQLRTLTLQEQKLVNHAHVQFSLISINLASGNQSFGEKEPRRSCKNSG